MIQQGTIFAYVIFSRAPFLHVIFSRAPFLHVIYPEHLSALHSAISQQPLHMHRDKRKHSICIVTRQPTGVLRSLPIAIPPTPLTHPHKCTHVCACTHMHTHIHSMCTRAAWPFVPTCVLQQQLAALATQTLAVQSSSLTFVEWPLGNRLPVRHERVRAAVQQASADPSSLVMVLVGARIEAKAGEGACLQARPPSLLHGCLHMLLHGCLHMLLHGCLHMLLHGCQHMLLHGCLHMLLHGCQHMLLHGCLHMLLHGCLHMLPLPCAHVEPAQRRSFQNTSAGCARALCNVHMHAREPCQC